jgi:chromosome segregation ATPase
MDNTLLFVIAAFIVGVIIGLIIRSATARGRFDDLESKVRTLQNSADTAKRELTGAQSELKVRDSHINTLNSSIGILEEKTRRAEATAAEATALIATAQSEARQAGMDIPALKAELAQRDAELAEKNSLLHDRDIELGGVRDEFQAQSELLARAEADLAALRAQLDALNAEKANLQSGLDAVAADKGDLEAQLAAAREETERLAGMRDELNAVKGEMDEAQVATAARLSAIENQPRLTAKLAELPQDADPMLFELRDHLVRMTFAGALVAKRLDDKTRELDDLKANLDMPGDRAALAGAGLVASGYQMGKEMAPEAADDVSVADEAVAAVAPESIEPQVTPESPVADLNAELQAKLAEIETLKHEKASLMDDLQTALNSKTELASQLEKSDAELNAIKTRIMAAREKVRELLSRMPADAVVKAREAVKAQTGA